MLENYAKVIIKGSPISKSNFKLSNMKGRAILPYNTGKYNDRYAVYEETIAYEARVQNPRVQLSESLIAVLHVFYKSKKRHPDTTNITKSIFDGIEKSGIIINDAQIRRLIIEEYYDSKDPRFELELFGESTYSMKYEINKKERRDIPIEYDPPSNKKMHINETKIKPVKDDKLRCEICNKIIQENDYIRANNGKSAICKSCFKKLF